MDFALGTGSRSSSSRLASTCVLRTVMPVTLPPGRFRLATKPVATGSKPVKKMIGMDVVAALAATIGGPAVNDGAHPLLYQIGGQRS